jgi:hypothetical protein
MTKIKQSDFATSTEVIDLPRPPIKTRAEKVREWRNAHEVEWTKACESAHCTCTPTRAEMLIMQQYEDPPVD